MLVKVGSANEIVEGRMSVFDIDGIKVSVAKTDGHLHAFDDTCTHRGCSLAKAN